MPTAAISGKRVFSVRIMASVTYVASPVPRLVPLEVVKALGSAPRQRPAVAMMRIKAVVDMAVKAVRTMEPWASAKKHPTNKPIGPVVAVWSAVIRGIIEVSVRTYRSRSDVYANRHLGWRHRCTA